MPSILNADSMRASLERLHAANRQVAAAYPGERADRQPVHVVYGGAHLFTPDAPRRLGDHALALLTEYAPTPAEFAQAIGWQAEDAELDPWYARVVEKLKREPVEDYRIDFEDGYGPRPDAEEDAHADAAAEAVARGLAEHVLPPFIGIRIKPLNDEQFERGLRTLERFVTRMLERTRGMVPPGFVVTLPKITAAEQVATLVDALELLERAGGLFPGALKLEFMVETTQCILGPQGHALLPELVQAARGRCRGAHFGVYDYTAACGITAAEQGLRHPTCDFARAHMQAQLAGTAVQLSDGASNLLPIPPHAAVAGAPLSEAARSANRRAIHDVWRANFLDVRHSLRNGYFQGWDMHPGHLPVRFGAVYSFYMEARDQAVRRLRSFVDRAARATALGHVFDDAATGQALLNFFLRGLACGALSAADARATGLTPEQLALRSFSRLFETRSAGA